MSLHRSETATPTVPATTPQPKPRLIPRKVRQAIELIVSGACKTKTAAAAKVGMTRAGPRGLSFWLNTVEGSTALRNRAAAEVASSAGRASARLVQLLDSKSEKVSIEAVKYSLSTAGIKPTSDSASVNVNVELRAGYVIDLSGRSGRAGPKIVAGETTATTIDAKPAEAKAE